MGITMYAYYLSGTVLEYKFEGSFALTDLAFSLITTELYALFDSAVFKIAVNMEITIASYINPSFLNCFGEFVTSA